MTDSVLIVGASGIIGRYASAHLSSRAAWQVTGLARSRPVDMPEIGFIATDLLAPAPDAAARAALSQITHVVYAGYLQPPGADWSALSEINTRMFRGLLDLLEAHAPALRRIVLMQGQKYYGSHLGPFKTPAREDDPRPAVPNFYYGQQDLLEERSRHADWDWVCLRPHIVCGLASGSPMNLILLIGVYASLCKSLGLPLRFPGKASAYGGLNQATDAGLLARSVEWALTTSSCAGQAFNITNGDLYRWEQIWPIAAEVFALEPGPPASLPLQDFLTEQAPLWRQLAAQYGLASDELSTLVDGAFGDYVFNVDWDVIAHTIKARQHGFHDCRDSEEMFRALLGQLRSERQVP